MVATRPRLLADEQSNKNLVRFVLLSLALHAALLYWLRPFKTEWPHQEPLDVTLSARPPAPPRAAPAEPPRAQKSAVAERLPMPATTPMTSTSNPAPVTATISPAPATPAINLDAAIATARAYAHETQPRTSLDAPKPMFTVETAVARAAEPDVTIETHGAAGEHVTTSRHSRCVTAIVVPHYMQGMTMPTLCGKR